MSAATPSRHRSFHAQEIISPLLHLSLLLHPHGISSSRGERRERRRLPSYIVDALDQLRSLPLEINFSPMDNPNTPTEHLVDAVRNLRPFLPIGCELLGQGDLKVVGSHPIDAGGFADVWAGEKNNGITVAIKSLRHYSSSNCATTFLVSDKCYHNVIPSLNGTGRGCIRKR